MALREAYSDGADEADRAAGDVDAGGGGDLPHVGRGAPPSRLDRRRLRSPRRRAPQDAARRAPQARATGGALVGAAQERDRPVVVERGGLADLPGARGEPQALPGRGARRPVSAKMAEARASRPSWTSGGRERPRTR